MDFSILIAIIAVAAVIIILMQISSKTPRKTATGGKKTKSSQKIIAEATKKLTQNPNNTQALATLSAVYFNEHQWSKALPLLEKTAAAALAHQDMDTMGAMLRLGICQMKLKKNTEALKSLTMAFKLQERNPEVNFYLGQIFYQMEEFEKAIPYLKRAITLNRELPDISMYAGLACFYGNKSRDALPYLKQALNENPENKECLFAMAGAMRDIGMSDKALKIFRHLRADPIFGAKACLAAGNAYADTNQTEKAIADYEIGLKHKNIPTDIRSEIMYRLANCYISSNTIGKGLSLLRELNAGAPGYKDTAALISRYTELNQNANLQAYLISGSSDFISLCRKIVDSYFPRSRVKILDISTSMEYTEILADIQAIKWQDTALFRFYRTTGAFGELNIRDFYGKVQDSKVGRGVCLIAGVYSEDAARFAEGRPIDLVDKTQLIKLLKTIDKTGA